MQTIQLLSRNEMKKIKGMQGGCSATPCDTNTGFLACCCRDGSRTCIRRGDTSAYTNYCNGYGPW
jgi:Tfp pilus assembly protein PilX